jgi:integrase
MVTVNHSITWNEAVRGFVLHKQAVRSLKTAYFYRSYVSSLAIWAESRPLSLSEFTKRHLDEYLVYRAGQGRTPTTLHHDALCATVFFEWCKRNDLLDRDPLAEYKVRNAPKTFKYMPTQEDIKRLIAAVGEFYDPISNPDAKYCSPAKRTFHRERMYAIILVELDSACRIGEILSLQAGDYQGSDKQITIRESKGREPRSLPVSPECARALDGWLKVRKRVMSNVTVAEDEGWLFISETGGRMDEGNFLRTIKKVAEFAGLPKEINNHSQRRFSLNALAKEGGLLFAQEMAGHKDPKTTLTYLKIGGDYMREKHNQVSLVRGLLGSNRRAARKRLV